MYELENCHTEDSNSREQPFDVGVPRYQVGEYVRIESTSFPGQIFYAQITKSKYHSDSKSFMYYIHYNGWSSGHDEWMTEFHLHPLLPEETLNPIMLVNPPSSRSSKSNYLIHSLGSGGRTGYIDSEESRSANIVSNMNSSMNQNFNFNPNSNSSIPTMSSMGEGANVHPSGKIKLPPLPPSLKELHQSKQAKHFKNTHAHLQHMYSRNSYLKQLQRLHSQQLHSHSKPQAHANAQLQFQMQVQAQASSALQSMSRMISSPSKEQERAFQLQQSQLELQKYYQREHLIEQQLKYQKQKLQENISILSSNSFSPATVMKKIGTEANVQLLKIYLEKLERAKERSKEKEEIKKKQEQEGNENEKLEKNQNENEIKTEKQKKMERKKRKEMKKLAKAVKLEKMNSDDKESISSFSSNSNPSLLSNISSISSSLFDQSFHFPSSQFISSISPFSFSFWNQLQKEIEMMNNNSIPDSEFKSNFSKSSLSVPTGTLSSSSSSLSSSSVSLVEKLPPSTLASKASLLSYSQSSCLELFRPKPKHIRRFSIHKSNLKRPIAYKPELWQLVSVKNEMEMEMKRKDEKENVEMIEKLKIENENQELKENRKKESKVTGKRQKEKEKEKERKDEFINRATISRSSSPIMILPEDSASTRAATPDSHVGKSSFSSSSSSLPSFSSSSMEIKGKEKRGNGNGNEINSPSESLVNNFPIVSSSPAHLFSGSSNHLISPILTFNSPFSSPSSNVDLVNEELVLRNSKREIQQLEEQLKSIDEQLRLNMTEHENLKNSDRKEMMPGIEMASKRRLRIFIDR